jgi:hypothetical protein
VLRVVLYAEDTAQARSIAGQIEEDPSWELIALCATLADLNFVLDRVTVDLLLLRLTPEPRVPPLPRLNRAVSILRNSVGVRIPGRAPADPC